MYQNRYTYFFIYFSSFINITSAAGNCFLIVDYFHERGCQANNGKPSTHFEYWLKNISPSGPVVGQPPALSHCLSNASVDQQIAFFRDVNPVLQITFPLLRGPISLFSYNAPKLFSGFFCATCVSVSQISMIFC